MPYLQVHLNLLVRSLLIVVLLILLTLPAIAQAKPVTATPRLTDGAAQTVALRTGPGVRFPLRYEVNANDLSFTARYENWVQVGMIGWLPVDAVDPDLLDVSDLVIPDEVNGLIVGVMPRLGDK